MEIKIITSKKFTLDGRDFLSGLLIAVLTPVLVLLQKIADSWIETGAVHINLTPKQVAMTAIGGGVGYLLKKWFSPSKTILKNVSSKNKNNGNEENTATGS